MILEVIREADLRLPDNLAQPVAIASAVVVGQSAVTAGLISAPTIVVFAFAFVSLLAGAAFGTVGVKAAVLVIFAYLCPSRRSVCRTLCRSARGGRGVRTPRGEPPRPPPIAADHAAQRSLRQAMGAGWRGSLSSGHLFWLMFVLMLPTLPVVFIPPGDLVRAAAGGRG